MSGLLDIAMAGGWVIKPSNGWYQKPREDKKYRASELNAEFFKDILEDVQFHEFVSEMYQIGHKSPVEMDLEEEI
jgi:ribosomal protein S25